MGGGIGFMMFGLFGVMYSVGLWYGIRLVDKNVITIGDMFGCYFSFMIAGMALGQMGSVGQNLKDAAIASNFFYSLKNRQPKIRPPDIGCEIIKSSTNNNNNNNISRIQGKIEFRNVCFNYPNEPNVCILNQVNFLIPSGSSLAICGPSGSGKSTIISLLERYYDPQQGDILIDGEKIHNYNIDYVRSQLGLVSQMPLLFDATIEENIKGGIKNATREEVINAAKLANAHDFIMQLPIQYDTNVGEMGGRLSGGQRQRIAIARAMLKRPPILLLDEATSALDSKSEREVQLALDKIALQHNQTIIVIAHRLSTITNADKIVVLGNGRLVEQGSHKELMYANGVYSTLVKSQQLIEEKKATHAKSSQSSSNILRSSRNVVD